MRVEPPSSRSDFGIGIICALALEFNAVHSLLDTVWDEEVGNFGKAYGDKNSYVNGRIGRHNVVLVRLPQDKMGKVSAAVVATQLRISYSNVSLSLVVGICGGVPNPKNGMEIVLGDVVVSTSVVQYDFGRDLPDGFMRKNTAQDNLSKPNEKIAAVLSMFVGMDDGQEKLHEKTALNLKGLQAESSKYAFPGTATDKLYKPEYRHKHQISPACECKDHQNETDKVCGPALEASCDELGCEETFLVRRERLEARAASEDADEDLTNPKIYFGPVASGDTVMKSGMRRDRIAEREGVIAFEMEGAGIWEHLSCLVVKGVCDYADSHKNKSWQNYAAATAAAAAKAILMRYIAPDINLEGPIDPRDGRTQISLNIKARPQWVVPLQAAEYFVDRPDILDWLSKKSALPGARVALVGLGGIGKSQLAIGYANQVREKSHVFWVNATTRDSLEQSYKVIAENLELVKPDDSMDAILQRVSRWLGREANGRWTVVVDNFDSDESSILTADDPHLSALLPHTSTGFTIITSRSIQMAERLTGSAKNIWPVKAMTEEGALKLFQTNLRNACEEEEALQVVRLLDCVPLAISQAAAYINRPSSSASVGEYLEKLQNNEERKSTLLQGSPDLSRYSSSESVLETWTITLEQVRRERPSAMDLLAFMSFFNPQAIPEHVLKGYIRDPDQLPNIKHGDLAALSKSSFLSLISRPSKRYENVSPDVAFWIWRKFEHGTLGKDLEKDKKEKSWKLRGSSLAGVLLKDKLLGIDLDETFLGDAEIDEAYEKDLETLLGYSLVATTAKRNKLEMHPLVQDCTQQWLSESGNLERWKRRFLMVMADAYKQTPSESSDSDADLGIHLDSLLELEPADPITARAWSFLCLKVTMRWENEGHIQKARALLTRLISVGEAHLGEADELTTNAIKFLAMSFEHNGELNEAEPLFADVLKRMEKRGETDSDRNLSCREQRARVLLALQRNEEAKQLNQSIVDISQKTRGPQSRWAYRSMGYQAEGLVAMGKYEEAGRLIVRVLGEDWEDIKKENGVPKAAWDMAMIPECEAPLRNIVEAAERVLNTYPVFQADGSASFHEILGNCLAVQGKIDEAKSIVSRGMRLRAEALPDDKAPLPPSYAALLEQQGEYEEAEAVRRANVEYFACGHPVYIYSWHLQAMSDLGKLLCAQGKTEEGAALLWKVYEGQAESLGDTHSLAVKAKQVYDERENLPEKFQRNMVGAQELARRAAVVAETKLVPGLV